jgi:hypothetical protein
MGRVKEQLTEAGDLDLLRATEAEVAEKEEIIDEMAARIKELEAARFGRSMELYQAEHQALCQFIARIWMDCVPQAANPHPNPRLRSAYAQLTEDLQGIHETYVKEIVK